MYRKMKENTKSVAVAKRERARRQLVLQLTEQGCTQAQIAEQLGVSSKTVYRDLKRLRPYVTRLCNKCHDKILELWSQRLSQYTIIQRFEILGDLMLVRGNARLENKIFSSVLAGTYKVVYHGKPSKV